MNLRLLLGIVVVIALGFAGYQAYLITRSAAAETPATSSVPSPVLPTQAAAAPVLAEPTIARAPGMDAPYDVDVARRIEPEQVKTRLDRGQKIVFVDTRAEIPDVMIKDAVQVPESALETWSKGIPKTSFVVTYCTCADEATAAREVLALQAKGFKNAYALKDGLAGWQSFDLPTQQPPHAPEP